MGDSLGKLFIDPHILPQNGYGLTQLIFLMVVYAYVLFFASSMISSGSELLLLVPALAGLVGSVVLPVLGAVPDGAIVLFSGLGPDAEEQLSVGVGALAGSTIMLLTIPWALSIFAGRVTLDSEGHGAYKRPLGAGKDWAKLQPPGAMGLLDTGVNCSPSIRSGAYLMLATTIPYFLIQGPAFIAGCGKKEQECDRRAEWGGAVAGLCVAVLLFGKYLVYQVKHKDNPVQEGKVNRVRKSAIEQHLVSLSGIFGPSSGEEASLLPGSGTDRGFRATVLPFFLKYDKDGNGVIDELELGALVRDFNESLTREELRELMREMDHDASGGIDFEEFVRAMDRLVHGDIGGRGRLGRQSPEQSTAAVASPAGVEPANEQEGDEENQEEESEEMPEDFLQLTPQQQRRAILRRAFWLMGAGTLLVLLFSDPMVDVLSEFGNRIHVPPFYVSFILAPLASNASELIAAFQYSKKQTRAAITISFASLQGAACMNNTFCLGIFLALIVIKRLAWKFSAETIAILTIQLVMFLMGLKTTHTLLDAALVLSLYPLSLALVFMTEFVGLN
eukprot:EG_transcript_8027